MSGLRTALLAGAVVVGAILIANAFPSVSGPSAAPSPSPSASTRPTTGPSPKASPTPNPSNCGAPNGEKIAVENAADPSLSVAGPAADKLRSAGYTIAPTDVSNATSISQTTIVFYRTNADKSAAACLKSASFPTATLKPMSAGGTGAHPAFSHTAKLAVFLGKDYAATHH